MCGLVLGTSREYVLIILMLSFWSCHSVVRSYLLHYGYRDTLLALDVASGNMAPPAEFIGDKMVDEESYALDHRKKLRQVLSLLQFASRGS